MNVRTARQLYKSGWFNETESTFEKAKQNSLFRDC
jgi:hypothetical protein